LRARDLHVEFPARGRRGKSVKAVGGVSFEIRQREILGLVGESGSGKTTIGRVVAGLLRPTRGDVAIGDEVYLAPGHGRPRLDPRTRARIQVVFQDPYGSLNPRRRVRDIVAEPFRIHRAVDGAEEVASLLRTVELPPETADRYPAHLSGGQRQRVAIARALALRPDLVIADEAVSALDVTTRTQILGLLRRLRDDLDVSFLFVSHDLGVVADLCDRVLVLHDGLVVEHGDTREVFTAPQHAYTRLLLESIPGTRRGLVPSAGGRTHV
jgi:peptide/nickel transport system ATP-binding protein